ncbi:helix-turn-helix domain-containing protein [Anaeromassilibacillus senegalensis]|uniref:helix-turn-helix domain-containing protein n=1 Tax=Anaeromassilibacillus senegalensis TaxID=1673717 RepID=UPI000680E4D4|nr:helix-turn-helix transcriptional regulator [Anaeromassilibacillus senegalensis]
MNHHFPRIITLLRKERGLSQKSAAEQLGVSQALLSHYEKGIRECGLEFVVRVADFYNVSTDYLLGRSPHRTGAMITVEDLPEPDAAGKENVFKGSLLPTLNKKLIANSLNIIYSILQKCNNKHLTTEISAFLSVAVYKAFRLLYSSNGKNPQGLFSIPQRLSNGRANAAQEVAISNAEALSCGENVDDMEGLDKELLPVLSPEQLSAEYPLFSSSLFNLIQNAEARMGSKKQGNTPRTKAKK